MYILTSKRKVKRGLRQSPRADHDLMSDLFINKELWCMQTRKRTQTVLGIGFVVSAIIKNFYMR